VRENIQEHEKRDGNQNNVEEANDGFQDQHNQRYWVSLS